MIILAAMELTEAIKETIGLGLSALGCPITPADGEFFCVS